LEIGVALIENAIVDPEPLLDSPRDGISNEQERLLEQGTGMLKGGNAGARRYPQEDVARPGSVLDA
jgi:hypothetical protein